MIPNAQIIAIISIKFVNKAKKLVIIFIED